MTTFPYSDLLAQVEALAGASLSAPEQARVKIFANRRARKAYRETPFWPRFYRVGEERIISETGLLPLVETGKDDIDTVYRIYTAAPYATGNPCAYEYPNFYADSTGIQVSGYVANRTGDDMIVSGTTGPETEGIYINRGVPDGAFAGLKTAYSVNGEAITGLPPAGVTDLQIFWDTGVNAWTIASYEDTELIGAWTSTEDVETPDLVQIWVPFGDSTGTPIVDAYAPTIFVTYLAALPSTYGDGDGEESDVPEEWFEYMAQGAYADWLRSDGQTEKAMAEEAIAAALLDQQLEKISRQGGQQTITRFMTNANTQWR